MKHCIKYVYLGYEFIDDRSSEIISSTRLVAE